MDFFSKKAKSLNAVLQHLDGSTPIVLWHGLGQSCCDPDGLGRVRAVLERVTRAHVLSIRIGDTAVEDIINSFFEPVNAQVGGLKRAPGPFHLFWSLSG